jgi:hypothetical protein
LIRHRRTLLLNRPHGSSRTLPAPAAWRRRGWLAALLLAGALTLPAAAAAQDLYSWSVAAMGGIGGSEDVSPGSRSFSHGSWQLEGQTVTDPSVAVGLRVGQLTLGNNSTLFGTRYGAGLTYVTLAGQYTFQETYYDSGVYIGLGGYRLSGTDAFSGASSDRTAAGGVIGITGEFKATRRFGVVVEISGHYVDISGSHIFGMVHGGLAFHF